MRSAPPISPSRRLWPALACVLVLAGTAGAQPAVAAHAHGSGVAAASAPVRASGIAATVQRATGYSPAQLSTRAVCGKPVEAGIRCYARILTLGSSGSPVAPLRIAQASPPVAGASTSGPGAYTAAFLQSAYDTTWLSANRGAGDTVAIVDAYGDAGAYGDMEQFRSANGLPQIPTCTGSQTSCFEVVNQNGQTTNLPTAKYDETGGWNVEESLDIDAVSSLCPLCKILMVEANSDDSSGSPDLETAVSEAAALGANQISLSWGSTDTPQHAPDYTSPYASINSGAILAASGDSAYPGSHTVQYPAGLPDVTAVGGTSLSADAGTARGYDESAWNLQTCSDGSACGTGSGCDTGVTKPTYQSSVTTECSGRGYNDISADADPDTGLEIYDSQPGNEGCGTTNDMCIVGGTSLATPLTAALEAITGTSATPAWTYTDASLLNDITSGSNGTCPTGESIICTAGIGWDGPTGNGSISGDLATGGPGIGGSQATADPSGVTFSGGLYPNGQSTSYQWLYWPGSETSASAAQTPAATVSGSRLQAVSSSACYGLAASTAYDYELVASNASGSETGYAGSFTTPATLSAPTASSSPAISGEAVSGQTLTATDADWSASGCNSSPSYAWQESPSSTGPWTTVGGGLAYPLTAADLGRYLQFTATESNGNGATTKSSPVVGPVTAPATTTTTSTTTSTTPATPTTGTGTTPTPAPTVTGPSTAPAPTASPPQAVTSTITSVRFYRCARRCTLIATHGASTYAPRRADWGHYLKVVTTVTRTTGGVSSTSSSSRWRGPITSATAGDIGIGDGARIAATLSVRGSTGRSLAQVRVSRPSATSLTLTVRRSARRPTQAWAYVISRGAVVSATRTRSLNRPLRLRIALKLGQTIRLVALRT